MSNNNISGGGFTLPGEAGCEELTLELADRWGADVIRDSDGTVLSDDIINAGYGIYSTICIIRDHNEWARKNMDKLQSCLLMSAPCTAVNSSYLVIDLMKGYFKEQFSINDTEEALRYYQVIDRTTGTQLDRSEWDYIKQDQAVLIKKTIPFHEYTVNFFVWRIWEEISMYNHTTNNWDKEHLMQIDPIYDETREYIKKWLIDWCEAHPATTVVRFTSMFYNFVWIWGANNRNKNLYSDWGSYDFTVSPRMLDLFEKEYGYSLTAEDFINGGKLHVTHMPPTKRQKDYMAFVNKFVAGFGRELVDIVHSYGKKAYVFYDDSWIGVEPTNERFADFDFDGLIKCVFSGFEVRLNASVPVETHEIRLHPYLFPVGLGGAPTFMEGGNPTLDAKLYWKQVRRAMLRVKIDRIGLGGYIHLLKGFPDFVDYIEELSNEFRSIRQLHENGKPEELPIKICVVHSWGKLRRWILSGHFHETYMHDLIHINEALSGLPVDVDYMDFDELKTSDISGYQIMINAGKRGTAWSGGDNWKDSQLIQKIREWTYNGGTFIGVNEPTAVCSDDGFSVFALSDILGVDLDIPARVCHGKWQFTEEKPEGLLPEGAFIPKHTEVRLNNENTTVVCAENGYPTLSINPYGSGKGIYLAGFETNSINNRMLMNLLQYGAGIDYKENELLADKPEVEFAYFMKDDTVVVVNNSDSTMDTVICIDGNKYHVSGIKPYCTVIYKLSELEEI